MAIVESLEMRKRLCCGSMARELHISNNSNNGNNVNLNVPKISCIVV